MGKSLHGTNNLLQLCTMDFLECSRCISAMIVMHVKNSWILHSRLPCRFGLVHVEQRQLNVIEHS